MFIDVFPRNVPFMRVWKNKRSQAGHRSQYDTAHALCMLDS
jgi:hypothetical protein